MKKYVTFFLLLSFTAFFIVGGFLLPGFLLERQQDSLFDKTETMILPTVSDLPSGKGFRKFSTEKLLQVASSYSFEIYGMDYWLTYTPEEGQLTTEELLQVAHQQINRLCELGILPDLFSSENYTYEGVEHGIPWSPDKKSTDGADLLNSDYSGWVVSGGNSGLTVTAYVNSVSGRILYLNASWNSRDLTAPSSAADISHQYLNYLELDQEPVSIQETEDTAICIFENYNDYILNVLLHSNADLIVEESDPETEDTFPVYYSLSISILNEKPESGTESDILSP